MQTKAITLRKDALTETFEDVKNLIHSIVHSFISKYGTHLGNHEELFAVASLLFIKAYDTHDIARSSFPTACRWIISKELLEMQRVKLNRASRCQVIPVDMQDDTTPDKSYSFSLVDFLDELSSDASIVVSLTLDTPPELRMAMIDRGSEHRNTRAALKSHLKNEGWSHSRIKETFNEIANVLKVFNA